MPVGEAGPLRQIRRAFQERKRGRGWKTFVVSFPSEVTIDLTDCDVTVKNELVLAFADIKSPGMVDLIRDCPSCGDLFWAGRDDKVACSKHAGKWRKKEERRRKKLSQAEAERERSEAQRRKIVNRLSHTAVAVINAIMARGKRVHWEIDNWACYDLIQQRDAGNIQMDRIPNNRTVRQILAKLVREEYLSYQPDVDPTEDRYEPEDELLNLWNDIGRFRNKPATH